MDPGSADYARLSTLAGMAADTLTNFPPGIEFFTATWGNPASVLQPTTRVAGTLPEGDSLFALAWRFGGGTARYGISGGRGMRTAAANPANARLGGQTYRLGQMMNVSPLVLDMDRDGALGASAGRWLPHPASLDGPYARFDMDGDGYPDLTEWMAPGDALLCRTPTPSTARDFFGSIDGWPDGFARLAAEFDADTNGAIEGVERDGLFVWEDADGDAVPDAGEVQSLTDVGILWLSVAHTGHLGAFADTVGTNALWDWWPNFAEAHGMATDWTNQPTALPGACAPLAPALSLPDGVSMPPLSTTLVFTAAEMSAAGLSARDFHVLAAGERGRRVTGWQATGTPARVHIVNIDFDAAGSPSVAANVALPFDDLYQAACDHGARRLMLLGRRGTRLAMLDLHTGALHPTNGIDLGALGIRPSGAAGFGGGVFWFTARNVDGAGRSGEERVWALSGTNLVAGLSLDGLQATLGDLRAYALTGPEAGFFAASNTTGTGETLWIVDGDSPPSALAEADAFGAMAAVPGVVAFTSRTGTTYRLSLWRQGDGLLAQLESAEPFLFPHMTSDGGAAYFSQLSAIAGRLDQAVMPVEPGATPVPLADTLPGQVRGALGCVLHHGPDGLVLHPLPEAAPPRLTLVLPRAGGWANPDVRWPGAYDLWALELSHQLHPASAWTSAPAAHVLSGMTIRNLVEDLPRVFYRLRGPP